VSIAVYKQFFLAIHFGLFFITRDVLTVGGPLCFYPFPFPVPDRLKTAVLNSGL